MRALVALSEASCSAACGEFLASRGWELAQTDDPAMAMRLLRFRRYDAVIADLAFDHWQCTAGLDIVRAARRRGGDAVVVLLTCGNDASSAGLAAGADFVVPKPLPLEAVADLILETTTTRDRSRCPGSPAARRPLAPNSPI